MSTRALSIIMFSVGEGLLNSQQEHIMVNLSQEKNMG